MGDWYEIGVALGLGLAAGLLFAGAFAGRRYGLPVALVGAIAVGVAAGLLVKGWLGLPGSLLGVRVNAADAGNTLELVRYELAAKSSTPLASIPWQSETITSSTLIPSGP